MFGPLLFRPIFHERVWGGREIESRYGKQLPPGAPIGESWEISDRPGNVSVVAQGPFAGATLRWLVERHASALLGSAQSAGDRFPLLVKILDARDRLSLQVHPPGRAAAALGGEPKTELWYVAAADPGAELFIGLRSGTGREEFERCLRGAEDLTGCINRVRIQAGDIYFLPSGRIHAIGGGTVIFEIQQNSDTTYRVFDWNRKGMDGKPRALQVTEALAAIDFSDCATGLVRSGEAPLAAGQFTPVLADALFSVDLARIASGPGLEFKFDKCVILAVIEGSLQVQGSDPSSRLSVRSGEFALLPAQMRRAVIATEGDAQVLRITPG